MKLFKTYILFLFLSSLVFKGLSQNGKKSPIQRFFSKTPWTFNIGGHVVDDDGNIFSHLFDVKNTWNLLPYPTRVAIDGYIQKGWSFQGELAYTNYKIGKEINGEIILGSYTFFSTDLNVKYDLNYVIGDTRGFDPYIIGGYGFTMRTVAVNPNTFTANSGIGFNIWIFENLGFNAQTIAKFALKENTSNYLQHSVGVVYRFEYGKGSRTGKMGKRVSHSKSKSRRRRR